MGTRNLCRDNSRRHADEARKRKNKLGREAYFICMISAEQKALVTRRTSVACILSRMGLTAICGAQQHSFQQDYLVLVVTAIEALDAQQVPLSD